MSGRTAAGLLALLVTATGACSRAAPPAAPWETAAGYRWRPVPVPSTGQPGFSRLDPTATGIEFENQVSDSAALRNRILVQGGGVALGDIDGDDRVDVFLARTEGASRLYRNRGGFRFTDVTDSSGIDTRGRATTGAVFADIDGDGDQDLLLAALGGPNSLYRNDGHGRFTEDSTYPGRASRMGSTTLTLADVDGDGDLDLYIAAYKAYTTLDRMGPQERAFDQIVHRTADGRFEVAERYRADYKVILRDDLRGVSMVQRADPDLFYLNDGRGHFTRAPMANSPAFVDETGKPLAEEREDFGLSARFYDVDGDGAPDLYVANDFEDPDQFWHNDGHGNFRLVPPVAQRTTSNSGMAVDFGDLDRDGEVDFFEADMLSRDGRTLKTQIPTHTALPKQPGVYLDRPQMQRNTLFLGRGDGTFAQIAEYAGLDASGWTWGTELLDVDLDGYEDVLTTTGHPWDLMDADTQEKLRNRLTDVDYLRQRSLYPKLAVPNYAFRNRGDLTFEDVSDRWHFSAGPDISHGLASADLDGDGDPDVVINRLGAPALVLRNEATAPRVLVRLRGRAPNTQGVGAKIRVRGGPVPLQEREVTAGGLYLSHADGGLAFATGPADSVTLEVRWRSGRVSRIAGARPDRAYEIHEDGAGPPDDAPPPVPPRPLFVDAPLDHVHLESTFDETRRQLLLPNAFAQLGPGVTWYDVDGDGDEDLLIGAGRTGSLALLRNDRGRFTPAPLGLAAAGDLTTILPVPTERGTTLLAGQASYEAADLSAVLALPSVIGVTVDGRGRPIGPPEPLIPGDTASVGPLALADVDGDGDLDLFVGARLMPGAYPFSPSSRLFRNDGHARFSLDTANAAPLQHLGMVTAALFSDLDADGDPDLLLAIEWGPLKLFWNDHGRFQLAPESLGLTRVYSRWFGLAAGDFDGDGRLDLVTTSWGENTRPRVDSLHPLYLYFGEFDTEGGLDLLLAQRDERIGALAPVGGFARLARAVPSIAERLKTFNAFADASVDQVLGPAAKSALRLGVSSAAQLVWLNRGDHFEPHRLPREAQLAPAVAPVVGDFDGDGLEDLVLSQNFFPTELATPRYDAGRSLLLRGDGRGGFRAVPGQESGLLVYGDQRGAAAADYDQDGRLDLVITQNGAETRLFRNQSAAPGLRIGLRGPPGNPHAIGARLRLRSADGTTGPVREIQAGSNYWSMNGPTQVMAWPRVASVEIRWPGGRTDTLQIPTGAATIRAAQPR